MEVSYLYQEKSYNINVEWTEGGKSVVYRRILESMEVVHRIDLHTYLDLAWQLDTYTDDLYSQLESVFPDTLTSYNPKLPGLLQTILNDIKNTISSLPLTENGELLFAVFQSVFKRLQDTVAVYLEDNQLKNSERMRLKRNEKQFGKPYDIDDDDFRIKCSSNDVLLRLIDISSMLDSLPATQKRRVVQHIILKRTLKDIAIQEKVTIASVHKSIVKALKTLKELFEI